MLDKEVRVKLEKKTWDDIYKNHSNRHQFSARIRAQSIKAINDLTLLASKLPDDEQEKIFSNQAIEDLILAIISKTKKTEHFSQFVSNNTDSLSANSADYRRLQLCVNLINDCIDCCKSAIHNEFKDVSDLVKPAISQLNQTKSICMSINNKIELSNIKKEEGKRDSIYLFNLDKVDFTDVNDFQFLCRVKKLKLIQSYYHWVDRVRRKNDELILCRLNISPALVEELDNYAANDPFKPDFMLSTYEYEELKKLKPIIAKLTIIHDKGILVEYMDSQDKKMFDIQLDISKLNGSRYVFGKKELF